MLFYVFIILAHFQFGTIWKGKFAWPVELDNICIYIFRDLYELCQISRSITLTNGLCVQ